MIKDKTITNLKAKVKRLEKKVEDYKNLKEKNKIIKKRFKTILNTSGAATHFFGESREKSLKELRAIVYSHCTNLRDLMQSQENYEFNRNRFKSIQNITKHNLYTYLVYLGVSGALVFTNLMNIIIDLSAVVSYGSLFFATAWVIIFYLTYSFYKSDKKELESQLFDF